VEKNPRRAPQILRSEEVCKKKGGRAQKKKEVKLAGKMNPKQKGIRGLKEGSSDEHELKS